MQELIDKFIRRSCRIDGNIINLPETQFDGYEELIQEVFTLDSFSIVDWFIENIGSEYSVKTSNGEFWYRDKKYHRLDGPAQMINETCYRKWFIDGVEFEEEQFDIIQKYFIKGCKK